MTAIAWTEFEKEELVELLEELEQCQFTLAQLWSECDVHYVASCSCVPEEHALPQRVIEIRDQVIRRRQKNEAVNGSATGKLLQLLRRPFGVNKQRKQA